MVASASCREESWEGAEESEQGRRGGTSRARDGEGGVGGQPACWAANAASVLPLSAALCVVVIVLLLDVVTPLLLTKLKAWGDERGGGGAGGGEAQRGNAAARRVQSGRARSGPSAIAGW